MFWGTLLIVVGVLVILNAILPFSIPVGKILFACILIYLGISMLLPGRIKWQIGKAIHSNDTLLFSNGTLHPHEPAKPNEEFQIIFGKGQVDLTGVTLEKGPSEVTLNVVFGDGEILVPAGLPLTIETNAVFGAARTPSIFEAAKGEKSLKLKLNAVFGNVGVSQQKK